MCRSVNVISVKTRNKVKIKVTIGVRDKIKVKNRVTKLLK